MDGMTVGLGWISDEEIRRHGAYIAGVWGRPLCVCLPDADRLTDATPREDVVVAVGEWRADAAALKWGYSFVQGRVRDAAYVTWHDVVAFWSMSVRRLVDYLVDFLRMCHAGEPKVYAIRFEFARPIDRWIPFETLLGSDQTRVSRIMGYDEK